MCIITSSRLFYAHARTYVHTETCKHERRKDSSAERKIWQPGLLFRENKSLEVRSEGDRRGFPSDRKRVVPCRGAEDRKVAGTDSERPGIGIPENESIRSRAESTRRCVRLMTVTEIRRRIAQNTLIAEYLSCTGLFVGLGASFFMVIL